MHEENFGLKAAADLSACQYHIMRLTDGINRVNIASESVNNGMVGILRNAPMAAGRGATIGLIGEGKVCAGAAINSAMAWFTCNGSGRAIAAASGDMVCGRVLETAAADGQYIRCLQIIPYRIAAL